MHTSYILSPLKSSNPPAIKPIVTISQGTIFKFRAISIAGEINEKKDAAIMTPAANPSIASITPFLIFLKKNTKEAPKAVTPQVNVVAISA